MKPSLGVVGAGIAGLTLARSMAPHAEVTLYEKSRGFGGRVATRYHDPYRFDHGAQFFTARSKPFKETAQRWVETGIVAEWHARFAEFDGDSITARRQWTHEHPHFVGTPGMNALGQALAEGLDVKLNTAVASLQKTPTGWRIQDASNAELGEHDWLVLAMPATQARALLPEHMARELPAAKMLGCYSLMLGFDAALDTEWDAALVKNADISWMSVNSSKPGRTNAATLLVHATNRWADAHLDDDQVAVTDHLLAESSRVSGLNLRRAEFVGLHRWRYANIDRQSGAKFNFAPEYRLAMCGDWFIRGRIEAAWRSATELATALRPVIDAG